jgi:hypothetical protein
MVSLECGNMEQSRPSVLMIITFGLLAVCCAVMVCQNPG